MLTESMMVRSPVQFQSGIVISGHTSTHTDDGIDPVEPEDAAKSKDKKKPRAKGKKGIGRLDSKTDKKKAEDKKKASSKSRDSARSQDLPVDESLISSEEEPEEESNTTFYLVVGLAAAAVAGAWYFTGRS